MKKIEFFDRISPNISFRNTRTSIKYSRPILCIKRQFFFFSLSFYALSKNCKLNLFTYVLKLLYNVIILTIQLLSGVYKNVSFCDYLKNFCFPILQLRMLALDSLPKYINWENEKRNRINKIENEKLILTYTYRKQTREIFSFFFFFQLKLNYVQTSVRPNSSDG